MCEEYRFPCSPRQHSCPLSCLQVPPRSTGGGRGGGGGVVDKLIWLVLGPLGDVHLQPAGSCTENMHMFPSVSLTPGA